MPQGLVLLDAEKWCKPGDVVHARLSAKGNQDKMRMSGSAFVTFVSGPHVQAMTMTMTMTHSEKSHIRRRKAWPYRQECRGHDPQKKNLFY